MAETIEPLPSEHLVHEDDGTPHATDATLETIADQVLLGAGTGELAEALGYSPGGMRRLIQSPAIQDRLGKRRQHLLEAGARQFFRFLMNADRLAQDQLRDALDPGSKDNYKARTWILERIMPQRQQQSGEVNVALAINNEVMVQLGEALKATSSSLAGAHTGTPVLLEGKKALPPVDK